MDRIVVQPRKPFQLDTIKPIILGGTDARTEDAATENLGGISKSKLAQANGIAPLDINNKIPSVHFPLITGALTPSLLGPTELYTNQTFQFKINNFDILQTYDISVDRGTISRDKDILTYHAPSIPGSVYISVNNKHYTFDVLVPYIEVPYLTFPLNNAVNVSVAPTFQASIFHPVGVNDTQLAVSWQIATDAQFNDIVFESLNDVDNTHFHQIKPPTLTISTVYYARVKYSGAILGETAWSTPVTFTTSAVVFTIPQNEVAVIQRTDPNFENTGSWSIFGFHVELSKDGTVLLISDPQANRLSDNADHGSGAIYIYKRINNTWTYDTVLAYPFSSTIQWPEFGYGVALSADKQTIVVSGEVDNHGIYGVLYVFKTSVADDYTTLQLVDIYRHGDHGDNSYVWFSDYELTISDDASTIVVPAMNVQHAPSNNGSVFIFNFNGSVLSAPTEIACPDPNGGGTNSVYFGDTVSLSADGTRLAIGCDGLNKAYVYHLENSNWVLKASLEYPQPASANGFGWFVRISPDGMTLMTGNSSEPCDVCIFTFANNIWSLSQQLIMSDWVITSLGGCITSMDFTDDSEHIVIGSAWQSTPDTVVTNGPLDNSGAAYLLSLNNGVWEVAQSYYSPLFGANFGQSVSISGNGSSLAVGCTGNNANITPGNPSTTRGLVYIFE